MALEDLEGLLDSLGGHLAALESPLADLSATLKSIQSSAQSASSGVDNLKTSTAGAGTEARAMASSTDNLKAATDRAAVGFKVTASAIAALGATVMSIISGPIPNATGAMKALGQMMGDAITGSADKAAKALALLGPEGEAAGAALQGLAAVASATVGTFTTLMGVAIDVSQKIDLMRDRFAALAGSAAAGKAVQASLAALSASLPFASSQVNAWAQALLGAGVKGKQLEADIKAIAAATALMGETGGAAAETLFKRLGEGGPAADKLLKTFQNGGPKADKLLKEMGLSLKDLGGAAAVAKMDSEQLHQALAKAMAKKGAGPLADMALTFPAILQKAREGFLSLFGGLGGPVKQFMTAVKGLFGEFNKGSPLIKSLKPIVTEVFTTLFRWGTMAANVLRDIVKAIAGTGKPGALTTIVGLLKTIFTNALVLDGLKAIFKTIAVVILIVVAVVSVLAGVFASAVAGIVAAVGAIADALGALVDAASGAGSNFVDGLVGGITSGIGAAVDAVKGLASSVLGAFTGALGIHSPSTIMLEHGEDNIAGAAATGMDRGGKKVKASAARMGDAAVPEGGKGGSGARGDSGGGDGGPSIVFNDCTFIGTDESLIRRVMSKVWAELAGRAGAQPQEA